MLKGILLAGFVVMTGVMIASMAVGGIVAMMSFIIWAAFGILLVADA